MGWNGPRGAVLVCILAAALFCPSAFGLNPDWKIYQYGHRAWKIEDGFLGDMVNALAQDGDGYFWIATNSGLFQFDGVRFTRWEPPDGSRLPAMILSLLADRDGSLWIGTNDGLVHMEHGGLTRYKTGQGVVVQLILQDQAGKVWFYPFQFHNNEDEVLCAVAQSKLSCYGRKDGIPSHGPLTALMQDGSGKFWLGGSESVTGWAGGPAEAHSFEALKNNQDQLGVFSLVAEQDGSLLAGIAKQGPGAGLQRLRNGKWTTVSAEGFDGSKHKIFRVFVDRHQALWIGTFNEGIYRLYRGQMDHFDSRNGLSGDIVGSIFEDSEGSLWVGTNGGLDQFRDLAVQAFPKTMYPKASEFDNVVTTPDGTLWVGGDGVLYTLRNGTNTFVAQSGDVKGRQVTAIFGDRAGRMWIGLDNTMNLLRDGKFIAVRSADGKPTGFTLSMAEDTDGQLWALTAGPPRTLLRIDTKLLQATPLPEGVGASKIASDPRGGLWIGLNNGGILHFANGKMVPVPLGPGFNSRIAQLTVLPDGGVMTASESGVGFLDGESVQLLGAANGLPCLNVNSFVFDTRGDLWLYTECGLLEVNGEEFQHWRKDPSVRVQPRVFDAADGVRKHLPPFEGAARSVDGRLWFNSMEALQMVDPEHMHQNVTPPPVHIEGIRADFRDQKLSKDVALAPLTRDIEISYTAMSFAAPSKTLFRYRLTGFDQEWHDVGSRRQAVYMNLEPRRYTFQVLARNNDGVWNESGDTMSFTIAPKFYQTWWFRIVWLLAIALLLWGIYQMRLREVQRQFNAGLEERVGERTRIARELHDTLLQSLHGLMFQFQAARNMLPRSPEKAMETLDEAISGTEQAIAESRDAIHNLRPEAIGQGDLAQLLKQVGEELGSAPDANRRAPAFDVIVEGEPRMLSPMVQHEAYNVGREVIRNAFRHADAQHVEVEVRYGKSQLRLRLRDDGKGIDPKILEESRRPGHWGLPGVRERAERIGSQLDFWSETGAGTEVELKVPAAIAYATVRSGNGFKLFGGAGSREQS